MAQTLMRKKLVGKIYPTKHPIIYFHKGGLEEVKTLCQKNANQENVKGFIICYDVKMPHGRPYEITGFPTERPEIDKDVKIIGNWTQIDRETVRLEFKKDKDKEYIWDLHKQEIKINPPPDIPDAIDSFGYFIIEETNLEYYSQEIPEYDVPQTHTQKEKLKIHREELHKNKSGSDGYSDNSNSLTPGNKPIKITIKKQMSGDIPHKEINSNGKSIPSIPTKNCPFFDTDYVVRKSKMYVRCESSITDSMGEVDKNKLNRKIFSMIYGKNKDSPFFIFINRETENRIIGKSSDSPNSIGLLRGKKYIQPGDNSFNYIQIEEIITEAHPNEFILYWEERLGQLFREERDRSKHELVGWFMRIGGDDIKITQPILKKAKKWHRENSRPDSSFVGILKSNLIIDGDKVNVFSYNFKIEKDIPHLCDYVYSFEKINYSR